MTAQPTNQKPLSGSELTRAPALALAWSEWFCQHPPTRTTIALWQPAATCAALGIGQHPERELRLEEFSARGLDIIRRQSGGGAVILSPGVLCFEVIAPAQTDAPGIRESFRLLTAPICVACERLTGLAPVMAGISDLAVPADGALRKICGCAQVRKRGGVLVHGSLLVNASITEIQSLLAFPSEVPDYRLGRSHCDFCRSLAQLCDKELSLPAVSEQIRRESAAAGWDYVQIPSLPSPEVAVLQKQKYENPAWNLRRERTL